MGSAQQAVTQLVAHAGCYSFTNFNTISNITFLHNKIWYVYWTQANRETFPRTLMLIAKCPCLLLSELLLSTPLLGRRSRGRCWAAIRLSHRPEQSGHAVHEEVDGLDIGGQHGRRFVLLRTPTGRRGRHAPLYIRRGPKVARRPWAPRTVLEFAIKTRYVLDSWKTSCCP